jgi:hypothetical protein
MSELAVYTDTSVFGGVFDEEFAQPSKAFFELVTTGRYRLMVSDVTRREIGLAPTHVQRLFEEYLPFVQLIPIDDRVLHLRDAYVRAGVVGPSATDDAAHVAAASLAGADLIVSWNFQHMVHFDKIRQYNEVNRRQGIEPIDIRSPLEVIEYEDQDL